MSAEPVYSAKGAVIHKAPVHTRNDDGSTNITLGFPVCEVSDWVGEDQASTVAELLCRGERYDELESAIRSAHWALEQAAEDLIAFETGTRVKQSVSTTTVITAALAKIVALSPNPIVPAIEVGRA